MSEIRPFALVEFTKSYRDWVDRTSDVPEKVKEYVAEKHLFYLGEVPNLSKVCMVASPRTGEIVSCFPKEAFKKGIA